MSFSREAAVPRPRTRGAAPVLVGALLAALFAGTSALSSQELELRPQLPPWGDPGSAQAYFDEAAAIIRQDPRRAAELFEWAARLDPEWAEPLEGWRAAILIGQARGLREYLDRGRRNDALRLADSLRFVAQTRNPLQFRPFEGEIVQAYIRASARAIDPTAILNPSELEYYLESGSRSGSLGVRALFAYSNHDLPFTIELYTKALESADSLSRGGILAERGHVHAVAGGYEDALEDYDSALAAFRKIEDEQLIIFYESKAIQLYAMGLLAEVLQNPEEARRDYSRAIEEDLSFHPAHEGLARLALADGDTATAQFEYGLAVDLAPQEPALRMKIAGILLLAGDVPGAEEQAAAAVAANPYYAAPHLVLGALADRDGRATEAIGHYERFLEMAAQTDRNRGTAQNRLAALRAAAEAG